MRHLSTKPDSAANPPPYRDDRVSTPQSSSSSVLSLHSLEPPEYSDDVDDPSIAPDSDELLGGDDILVDDTSLKGMFRAPCLKPSSPNRELRTLSPVLSQDADSLYQLLCRQADVPVRPNVRLVGTHTELTQRNGEQVKNRVCDFELRVDCSYFFQDPFPIERGLKWQTLAVAPDWAQVHRGGLFKRSLVKLAHEDEESRIDYMTAEQDGSARLKMWCHAYCAAASHRWFPLIFRFRRTVDDWNTDKLRKRLETIVRATHYRGDLEISFPLENPGFSVYSHHWMNRARNNHYIWWACIILQLWLVCWPILWLCTGTYDGVVSKWWYCRSFQDESRQRVSRYASDSEDEWLAKWGPALTEAAFARRVGWVDEHDVRALAREGQLRESREASGFSRAQTGNALVDSAVGIFTGIHGAVRESERMHGWGVNTGGSTSSCKVSLSKNRPW